MKDGMRKLKGVFGRAKAKVSLGAQKLMPAVTAACTAVAVMPAVMGASADAGELLDGVIEIVCYMVTGLAAVFGVFGVVHYASANSEGDGPAKQKAMMQIGAAIMLVVVSMTLKNVQWSSFISTS